MATWVWVVIAIAVVAVIALVAVGARKRKTAMLRERFGPEYDRAVENRDGRRAAEADLRAREKQRAQFDVKPLPEATRLRFADEWRDVLTVVGLAGQLAGADESRRRDRLDRSAVRQPMLDDVVHTSSIQQSERAKRCVHVDARVVRGGANDVGQTVRLDGLHESPEHILVVASHHGDSEAGSGFDHAIVLGPTRRRQHDRQP